MDTIGVPYKIYYTLNKPFKKPNTTMFDDYKKDNFDYKKSIYVGDALGRKKDWSDSDLQFAQNIGIPAKTPEEIFNL